jgi:hypothetical protein
MPFNHTSNNAIPPAQTLVALIVSVVAGARRFAHTDWLRADKALHALLGIEHFPGTDTVRNLFKRFRQGHIEAFWRPLWKWLLELSWPVPADGFSLDLDSTVFQRSGHQEGAKKGYNPARPGRHSHHPLLAFLEARAIPYIVVARLTTTLKRKAAGLAQWTPIDDNYAWARFSLKLHGWPAPREFFAIRERLRENKGAVGRRLIDVEGYTFRVFVTNRQGDAAELWRDSTPRACVEQHIEELKNDVQADGFCMRDFFATESAFLSVCFTYNLLSLYQHAAAPERRKSGFQRPATLRAAVFIGGAILGTRSRKPVLHIAESWGGLSKHKPLIDNILSWQISTSSKLPPEPPGADHRCDHPGQKHHAA